MDTETRNHYLKIYRDGLLNDVLPFWMRHAIDREYGGFMIARGRDGSLLDTDKGIWQQGRFTWLLSTLYNTVEKRPEWLEQARSGVEFLRRYGFDTDGRMFFIVTRDGKPVRKRRYAYSEAFASIAFAAYAKASGDEQAAEEARNLLRLFHTVTTEPGYIPPKVNPDTRPMTGIGPRMILINLAQILRETIGMPECDEWIDTAIREIRTLFVKPEFEAVFETVGPNGEFIDHFDGRMLVPGHAIEAAWFIMHEAKLRGGDRELLELGTTILDWMWKRGWDQEYGGLLYFVDVKGLPVQEYWHDMKFWWPHNEAIIATLLAHQLTGDDKYAQWHKAVHDWAFGHFPDPEYGEWYGYLHRDGRISVDLKGNIWKGPFHLPRMLWYCWKTLESAG